jgi:hypothetical protein
MFVMADAIGFAGDPRAAALVDDGCEVVCCGTNAAGMATRVDVGSQDDHARIAARSDRLVAFT